MTKRTWTLIAFLVNLALLPLVLATPDRAAASPKSILFHCCKGTAAGGDYCCYYCCVFNFNCFEDEHCEEL